MEDAEGDAGRSRGNSGANRGPIRQTVRSGLRALPVQEGDLQESDVRPQEPIAVGQSTWEHRQAPILSH